MKERVNKSTTFEKDNGYHFQIVLGRHIQVTKVIGGFKAVEHKLVMLIMLCLFRFPSVPNPAIHCEQRPSYPMSTSKSRRSPSRSMSNGSVSIASIDEPFLREADHFILVVWGIVCFFILDYMHDKDLFPFSSVQF